MPPYWRGWLAGTASTGWGRALPPDRGVESGQRFDGLQAWVQEAVWKGLTYGRPNDATRTGEQCRPEGHPPVSRWGGEHVLTAGRVRRVLALAIVAALTATGFAACSKPEPYIVSLSAEPRVEGTMLILAGTTSLPDGARLNYRAVSDAVSSQRIDGWVICAGGRFRTGEDVSSWPTGTVQVTMTFDAETAGQPPDLRERCGENGTLLAGDCVVQRGPGKVAETRGEVTLSGPGDNASVQKPVQTVEDTSGTGTSAQSPAPEAPTIYVTKTGAKYHRFGCRYLSKSSIPLTLSEAKSRGLTPCSVCKPPL